MSRRSGVCVFCQHATTPLYRPQPRRRLSTTSESGMNNELPPGYFRRSSPLERLVQHQINLFSPVDRLRDAVLAQEGKKQLGPAEQMSLQYWPLSKPQWLRMKQKAALGTFGDAEHKSQEDHKKVRARDVLQGEAMNEDPTLGQKDEDGELLYTKLEESQKQQFEEMIGPKAVRRVLRLQLAQAYSPRDIYRVVAVAMQHKATAAELSRLHEPLIRAIYRTRDTVTDSRVLAMINAIVDRFRMADVDLHPEILRLALKFAARSRSLPAMKRQLKEMRVRELRLGKAAITPTLFRAVVAKFSIGSNGYGEIRNGRWSRRSLLKVLLGFDPEPTDSTHAYHFETFLDRSNWQMLHGWLSVLGRCRAADQIQKEWKMWLTNPLRVNEEHLNTIEPMTSKTRGDRWFVAQMLDAQGFEAAWRMFESSGLAFTALSRAVQLKMIAHAEFATTITEPMQAILFQRYEKDFEAMERRFGIRWVSDPNSSDGGYHTFSRNPERALETLSYTQHEPDYGYPWDHDEATTDTDRAAGWSRAEDERLLELDTTYNDKMSDLDATDGVSDGTAERIGKQDAIHAGSENGAANEPIWKQLRASQGMGYPDFSDGKKETGARVRKVLGRRG